MTAYPLLQFCIGSLRILEVWETVGENTRATHTTFVYQFCLTCFAVCDAILNKTICCDVRPILCEHSRLYLMCVHAQIHDGLYIDITKTGSE